MISISKRFVWADFVRIVGVYLVLVVHSSSLPLRPVLSLNDSLELVSFAIAKTCVPLLAMLSGALLLSKNEGYFSFFSKRVNRLVLPWLTWTLVYTVLIVSPYQTVNISKTINIFTTTLQSFWFLPMIVSLYLLTPGIRLFIKSSKPRDILYVIIIWFFVISIFPYLLNSLAFPRQVDNGLLRQVANYFGYFLLGYLISIWKFPKYVFSLSIFIFFLDIFLIVFTAYSSPSNKDISYLSDFISPFIIILSVSLFLILYVLGSGLQNKITEVNKKRLLLTSNAALGIYLIHLLIQPGVKEIYNVTIFSAIDNYLNAFILFIASLLIILGLQQIPVIKRFVG